MVNNLMKMFTTAIDAIGTIRAVRKAEEANNQNNQLFLVTSLYLNSLLLSLKSAHVAFKYNHI